MNGRKRWIPLLLAPLLCAGGQSARAGDGYPSFDQEIQVDLRLVGADDTLSWLDRGLGKLRHGGDSDGNAQTQGDIGEISLLLWPALSDSLDGLIHLQFLPDQKNTFDLVEAYLHYHPEPRGDWTSDWLIGAFFPPISLEHIDSGWTSPYSLTPSAINSWVGEELRTLGIEGNWRRELADGGFGLTAALFLANDPAGTLLAWRGWALHDRKTGIFDRVPLAPLPVFEPGGPFAKQAPWVEPVHEIDDNPGWYLGGHWNHLDRLRLEALIYRNNHAPAGFDGDQYSWDARFRSFGLRAFLDPSQDWELLAQIMAGSTRMGTGDPVYLGFRARYLMLSRRFGEQDRLSLRYEQFSTSDRDFLGSVDSNDEQGDAWTLAWNHRIDENQQLIAEILRVDSERSARRDLGLPERAIELQWQIGWRAQF